MIQIQFMKPFYTKVEKKSLRLVFAYQYFSVKKDDEVYHFVPIEGKEIHIDLSTREVKNLSEVFVFQRGNRFIRLPLYQICLISNIDDFLSPIIDEQIGKKQELFHQDEELVISQDVLQLIETLEKRNFERLIDIALSEKNEEMFYKLVEQKKSS